MKKFVFIFILLIYSLSFSLETEILDEDFILGERYSVTLRVYPEGNKFPTKSELQEIAYEIKEDFIDSKSYFVHFLLPKMELNSGAFAVANNNNGDNPTMEVEILYYILEYNKFYSKYVDYDENGEYYLRDLDNPKK